MDFFWHFTLVWFLFRIGQLWALHFYFLFSHKEPILIELNERADDSRHPVQCPQSVIGLLIREECGVFVMSNVSWDRVPSGSGRGRGAGLSEGEGSGRVGSPESPGGSFLSTNRGNQRRGR